jgi:CelD/BcsL family acetyltransferase involved in cellulose biosynthesis
MHTIIDVEMSSLPSRTTLEEIWRDLEARSEPSFFTSWTWLSSWLDVLPEEVQVRLLQATHAGKVVGLGLVVQSRAHIMRRIPVACWRVNATGIHEIDDLTIEYNGFLLDTHFAPLTAQTMLRHLLFKTSARRVEISCAQAAYSRVADQLQDGVINSSRPHMSHMVDLNGVRDNADGGYLGLLSANTRSQLRRSLAAYGGLGTITVHEAENASQAQAYLEALRGLHEASWRARGIESGFASHATAKRFHQSLIDKAFPRGEIQLLRIAAGSQDLGYIYSFRHRGRISFYQSGLHYGLLDKHDRPGMVCHAMAVEHNAHQGASVYDFLAGAHRYKASLSTHTEIQASHVFQRDSWLPRLDAVLKGWRGKLSDQARAAKAAVVKACMTISLMVQPWVDELSVLA